MRSIVAFFVIAFSAFSVAEEPANAMGSLQAKLAALNTFSAGFKQETKVQDGFVLDEQFGQMHFVRPNLLRWEAKEPFAQTLVADGRHIFLYDPDLNQVTQRNWISDPTQNPAAIFASDALIESHFSVTAADEVFYLKPLSESSSLLELRLRFEGDTPLAMEMDDNLGQTTEITFSDQEVDVSLDPSLFIFDIPEGAEIVTDG